MTTTPDGDDVEAVPAMLERGELATVADRLVEQARGDGVGLAVVC